MSLKRRSWRVTEQGLHPTHRNQDSARELSIVRGPVLGNPPFICLPNGERSRVVCCGLIVSYAIWSVFQFGNSVTRVPSGDAAACPIIDKEFRILNGNQKKILNLAFSQDGRIVAMTAGDGGIRLWAIDTGELLFERKQRWPSTVKLSADARSIAILNKVDVKYRIEVWSRANKELIWKYNHSSTDIIGYGTCLGLSAKGNILGFCGRRETKVLLWNAETGKGEGDIEVYGYINAIAFGQTKSTLAISYTKHETDENAVGINCVDLWDLKERKLWKSL